MSSPAERRLGAALLLPALGTYAVFLLFPLGLLVSAGFAPAPGEAGSATLHNYATLLDGYYARLFGGTLRIGLLVTLATAVLAYPLAYVLARAPGRWARLGLGLVFLPLMTSAVVAAFGWLLMLGRQGLVNAVAGALGLPPMRLLFTEGAVVVAMTQLLLPYMILPLVAAIERIPVALEEVTRNLGGNGFTIWRRVILPLSLPGLASGGILVFGVAISSLVIPAMLGGRAARMVGNEIYEHLLVSFNWPLAAALATLLMAVALGLALLSLAGLRRGATP